MAPDPRQAALALHRFGLGPRTGSIAAIASDPRGALIAEIERPNSGLIAHSTLPTSAQANRAVFEFNAERAARQRVEQARAKAAQQTDGMSMTATATPDGPPAAPAPEPVPLPRRIFLDETRARIDAALSAGIGFAERLVWFWSNHFCVNANATVMAGGYEREAIRPHVCGRFADMLLAAEGHPAMLLYLDNAASTGPNSVAGINRSRGLNENLAREILELHTLGVRSVYSQDDVTSFAKIITGWTILPTQSNPDHGGEFIFNKRMHEPGRQTVIGKTYADTGVEQGRAVLADLARHPATGKHIAVKLARHFVADQPPDALVDKLAATFLETDGDLLELAKTLVAAPESWEERPGKLKRPGEWLVAILRATGLLGDTRRIVQSHALLGQPLWQPPAPAGFSDFDAAWLDGLSQRLEIANVFAQRNAERLDPADIAQAALGPLASAETLRAIAGAESRPQALALLLLSPEFQRR